MVECKYKEDCALLNDFLAAWPLERVRVMSLADYVDINNGDTFCQWVETKTRVLGSIKGHFSSKFGIYKLGENNRYKDAKPQRVIVSGGYCWLSHYGNEKDEKKAFEEVRKDVVAVIEAALQSDFKRIDKIYLNSLFKWKIAFLYSDQSFVPIFKKSTLETISSKLGLKTQKKTQYSEMHDFIKKTIPVGMSVFDYMRNLYHELRVNDEEINPIQSTLIQKKRKGVDDKNTDQLFRRGSAGGVVMQFHSEIQLQLRDYLYRQYDKNNVTIEEDYIDVKVELPNEILLYEVKTGGRAETCIRQGLGQLLSYAFNIKSDKKCKLIIFGINKPSELEVKYIEYITQLFSPIEFSYMSLDDITNTATVLNHQ